MQAIEQRRGTFRDWALQYAGAMAAGRVNEWAALDLGCLARQLNTATSSNTLPTESEAQACWDATMTAHVDLVYDETEPGIFGALGRGTGLWSHTRLSPACGLLEGLSSGPRRLPICGAHRPDRSCSGFEGEAGFRSSKGGPDD